MSEYFEFLLNVCMRGRCNQAPSGIIPIRFQTPEWQGGWERLSQFSEHWEVKVVNYCFRSDEYILTELTILLIRNSDLVTLQVWILHQGRHWPQQRLTSWRRCSHWVTSHWNRKLRATHLVYFNTSGTSIMLRVRSDKAHVRDAEHITNSRL